MYRYLLGSCVGLVLGYVCTAVRRVASTPLGVSVDPDIN
jgi:hypothetical protein